LIALNFAELQFCPLNFLHIARVCLSQATHRGGGGLRRRAWPLRGLAAALAVAQAWAGRSSVVPCPLDETTLNKMK